MSTFTGRNNLYFPRFLTRITEAALSQYMIDIFEFMVTGKFSIKVFINESRSSVFDIKLAKVVSILTQVTIHSLKKICRLAIGS